MGSRGRSSGQGASESTAGAGGEYEEIDSLDFSPLPPPYAYEAELFRNSDTGKVAIEMFQDTLGRDITRRELESLVGAPNDVSPRITVVNPTTIKFTANQAGIQMERTLKKQPDGSIVMINDTFRVAPELQGRGVGTRIFARQVEAAAAVGIKEIRTQAAGVFGSADANGYYTWARLGYKMNLKPDIKAQAKAAGFNAKDTHQLFAQPGGAAWWRRNGEESRGTFDLSAGSTSRQVLNAYVREKRIPLVGPPRTAASANVQTGSQAEENLRRMLAARNRT